MCCRHFVAIFGNPFSHAQDRASRADDCRMIDDPAPMIPAAQPVRIAPDTLNSPPKSETRLKRNWSFPPD
jgi:hypothetical protein